MIHVQHRLQPILISRFIINLRRTQHVNNTTQMDRESQFMPDFRVPSSVRFVGDMGEPLEFGAHDDEDLSDEIEAEAAEGRTSAEAGTRELGGSV